MMHRAETMRCGACSNFIPARSRAGAEAGLLPAGGAQHLREREHARLPDGL